jgi:uncharacterized membrane protein
MLLLIAFATDYSSSMETWRPLNNADIGIAGAIGSGLIATCYFAIKAKWWAVLGSTIGYAVALVLLGMLFEMAAGPAGF